MLRKFCYETGKEWDEGVPFVLFAIRDAKQEPLGFCPAELVFGHNVRGLLKVLQEQLMCSSSKKVDLLDLQVPKWSTDEFLTQTTLFVHLNIEKKLECATIIC